VKKMAASPPKEREMSARFIFLQVGASAPTCKKNKSRAQKVLLAAEGGDNYV
jgi:hypothetical protein